MLPQEEWEVLITGHHPGYLDWEAWRTTPGPAAGQLQGRRAGTAAAPPGRARRCCRAGPLRPVRPDDAGRLLRARSGDAPRYLCGRGTQLYGTGAVPEHRRRLLHRDRPGQLFPVLEPASLEATARAMADAGQRHRDQVAAFELALERARFEAGRAMRKHDEVEPGNRLVARTLEARLEERLAAVGTRRGRPGAARGPATRCT